MKTPPPPDQTLAGQVQDVLVLVLCSGTLATATPEPRNADATARPCWLLLLCIVCVDCRRERRRYGREGKKEKRENDTTPYDTRRHDNVKCAVLVACFPPPPPSSRYPLRAPN